jgi:hypothetical protein
VDAWSKRFGKRPQYKTNGFSIYNRSWQRRSIKAEWTSHGPQIKDASEIWFAAMEGQKIQQKGKWEDKSPGSHHSTNHSDHNGYTFEANHPIAKEEIPSVPKIKKILLKKKKAVQELTAFYASLLANCPQAASISLPDFYLL